MLEGKDIVALSIPFSAGVTAAAYMPSWEFSPYLTAAAGCAAAALLAVLYCRRDGAQILCFAMFFCAGIMGAAAAELSVIPEIPEGGLPRKALDALTGVIDGCGFGYGQTGPLVKALVTGQREGLSPETNRAFMDSGAVHILSLSGLHMGVIYGILHKSLAWTGRSRPAAVAKAVLTIAAAGFFTMMTGAGPSVVRAFLFIMINEISRLLPGRRRRPLSVLCTALMIQLIFDPMVIISLSFQLSYLAMLAIYTLFPIMEAWYPDEGKRDPLRRIWSSAALSISCQLFTAPLAWWHFRTFPAYFLISNLVALPVSEILIVCSVVTVAAEAAGCCPEMLKGLTDMLARALVKSLEVISSL